MHLKPVLWICLLADISSAKTSDVQVKIFEEKDYEFDAITKGFCTHGNSDMRYPEGNWMPVTGAGNCPQQCLCICDPEDKNACSPGLCTEDPCPSKVDDYTRSSSNSDQDTHDHGEVTNYGKPKGISEKLLSDLKNKAESPLEGSLFIKTDSQKDSVRSFRTLNQAEPKNLAELLASKLEINIQDDP